MKVAIVQHEIREQDVEWTLQHITDLMDEQKEADLYVLPEMFATGFMTEGAEEHGPRILNWMIGQARSRDAAIAGSVAAYGSECCCDESHCKSPLCWIKF